MVACLLLSALAALTAAKPARAAGPDLGFEVPPGFEVTQYADDSLATDIHCMTFDSRGRVVVAGKGYVKVLHDTDGDGKADKATLFADIPKSGAHGMYFDGNDLICDGDNGVRRLSDSTGAGRCDRFSPVWLPTKNDGEHAANGIIRGPDGWYYLVTGNDAGINRRHAAGPGSPVKDPNCGTVVRFSPDGKTSEVIADGFRNPYRIGFNRLGSLFTVDSDGERIHHLPYYTPTRLFDIAQGMHHGWILPGWAGSWARPQCWPDNVERLVEIGRGSPTGLVVYRHHAFPERYRHGVFSMCWTFGRVYFLPLERRGSSYAGKLEVFLRTTGDVGFAPTDMAVGPNGELFIVIGGRGTRGGVFCVRYKGTLPHQPEVSDPVRRVLRADEPLSSWSRAAWVPAARGLGKLAFVAAALDRKLPADERMRAVEVLTELFGGLPVDAARQVCAGTDEQEVAARAVWSLSRSNPSPDARQVIVQATGASNPILARAAWEALGALSSPLEREADAPDWRRGLDDPVRRVRVAAILAARGPCRASYKTARRVWVSPPARPRLAELWIAKPAKALDPDWSRRCFATCLEVCAHEHDVMVRLEAVRLLQLALGDVSTVEGPDRVFNGYAPQAGEKVDAKLRAEAARRLAPALPSGDADLDRELARLLGMLAEEVPDLPARVASRWTEKNSPEDDIHYLLVLARIPGKRPADATLATAHALNGIFIKLAKQGARPSDQVPSLLEGLCDRLLQHDPALAAALAADPAFGAPGHELLANRLPAVERREAAHKMLAALGRLGEDQAAAWSPDVVRLVAALPSAEALPVLRARFADPRLTDSIVLVLAEKRRPEDRARLTQALGSLQPQVVSAAAGALLEIPDQPDAAAPADVALALRALRRFAPLKGEQAVCQALGRLLPRWTGHELVPKEKSTADPEGIAAWSAWFAKVHPKEAASLGGMLGADAAAWKKRLARVDWSAGDVNRGEGVFQRQACFRCHGQARRLGPDLTGVAQRFSRDDLFVAIFDPARDVAPAYQQTAVVTTAGKVYTGVLIYSSQELTLLQTTPDTTVRIPGSEVDTVRPALGSFMPNGLLDGVEDRDLADLYAYLKSLRKR
jgi:putative heme-binding domain-containing protein